MQTALKLFPLLFVRSVLCSGPLETLDGVDDVPQRRRQLFLYFVQRLVHDGNDSVVALQRFFQRTLNFKLWPLAVDVGR